MPLGKHLPSLSCLLCASVYCWPFTLLHTTPPLISSSSHISFALPPQLPTPPPSYNSYISPSLPIPFASSSSISFNIILFDPQSIIMAVQAQYPSNVLLLNRFAFSLSLSNFVLSLPIKISVFYSKLNLYLTP